MAIYEKRDDIYCGSCGHFTRHYIWQDGRQARKRGNARRAVPMFAKNSKRSGAAGPKTS